MVIRMVKTIKKIKFGFYIGIVGEIILILFVILILIQHLNQIKKQTISYQTYEKQNLKL